MTIADHRVVVGGVSQGLPRFPPRPLLYMSWSNAARVLPPERLRTSFVVVRAAPGTDPADLARSIASQTGYAAFTRADFESATVQWFLATSEDVGDIATMLTIAVAIGFGFTTVMLYIFTADHLRQYAVLTALGARPAILWRMVAAQVSLAGLIGTGIGLGACALAGTLADRFDLPYRMMAWAPLGCLALNAIACAGAAVVSNPGPFFASSPHASSPLRWTARPPSGQTATDGAAARGWRDRPGSTSSAREVTPRAWGETNDHEGAGTLRPDAARRMRSRSNRAELTERVDQLDAENQELRSKVDDLTTQLEEAREAVAGCRAPPTRCRATPNASRVRTGGRSCRTSRMLAVNSTRRRRMPVKQSRSSDSNLRAKSVGICLIGRSLDIAHASKD